jgi:hypothetical protein
VNQALWNTKLVNVLFFQAGWFTCVLGAARGWVWMGTILGLVLVGAHVVLVPHRNREARLLAIALVLGLAVDSAHIVSGSLVFFSGSVVPGLAPPWILVLWMQIASTLRFSLNWLAGRYLAASVLGALAGAGAYAAGVHLGAAEFGPDSALALARIGFGWAVALPLLLFAAHRGGATGGTYRIFR